MQWWDISTFFHKAIALVFRLILCVLIVGIGVGTLQLLGDLWQLFRMQGITGHYLELIADVLTLYVLIELCKSLFEYFETRRLRMTFIVDAALIFIIREVLIGLFKHELKPDMLYALSTLILVLGALRIASALIHHYTRQDKES